jgi:hypothetical protein
MRPRARLVAAAIVPALVGGVARPAQAGTTTVSAEAGAEVDSNVERLETGPGLDNATTTTYVMRLGARLDHKGRALGGGYGLTLSNLSRVVPDDTVAAESVTLLAGSLRWLHGVHDRPVLVGANITAIDSQGIVEDIGARTFRNLGADALLVLRSGDVRSLTLGFGVRDFVYKPTPDHQFDWRGPSANARLEMILWQPASKTRSLELVTTLGFEARAFDAVALINDCPPNAPADPACSATTDLQRVDRYSRAGVELTWVGKQVAAIGYQLALIDSNSFGQSLARHRISASATVPAGKRVFLSLLVSVQLDQYLDGLIVRRDLQSQQFTNIEDENRSSLQLRAARKLGGEWAIEGRAAIWRNLATTVMELDFHRELLYVGLVYGK